MTEKNEFNLELTLKKIQDIVDILNDDEQDLDAQVKQYENALKHIKECRNYLESTEQKIHELNNK